MIRLSSIIQAFEADYLAQYAESLLPSQRQALAAMKLCRSSAGPLMQAQCPECDHPLLVPHSCGHRACPHCQHHESQQWLERQLKKQVPATYFLLTFTLPAALRPLAWAHQREIYALMTRCSWEDRADLHPKRPPAAGRRRSHHGPAHPFAVPGLPPPCASDDAGRRHRRREETVAHQESPRPKALSVQPQGIG
jgi:hypothetical protein